jgi:hypothetical protein
MTEILPFNRPSDPPLSRNQELLAQIQAQAKAADTPENRLLNELRGMEETLLGNHRQYVRLWEAAAQLGITPPVRTASQIVAEADGFPAGTPPLPPSIEQYGGQPRLLLLPPRSSPPCPTARTAPNFSSATRPKASTVNRCRPT